MKKKILVIALTAGMLLSAGFAQAGTTYSSFDLIVPPLNGGVYTSYQTKTTTAARGDLELNTSGGYSLDARMQASTGTGSWVRVSQGSKVSLPNNVPAGTSVRVHFSNDLSTLVNVRITGRWRSN